MTELFVDLLDGSGNKIGDGPLVNVLSASITEAIDEAGEFTITLPATDDRAVNYAALAEFVHIYAPDGYHRLGIIRNRRTTVTDQPALVLSGPDLVGEFGKFTCGWLADYNTDNGGGVYGNDINTDVVPDLESGTGWAINDDAGLGYFLGTFNGESKLSALKTLAERQGIHFRHSATTRTLDLGNLGDSSGFRLSNVAHVLRAQDTNVNLGLISSLEVLDDLWDVCNLIVPFGAGEDSSYYSTGTNTYGRVRLHDLAIASVATYITTDIQVRAGLRGAETTTTASGTSTTTVQVASTAGIISGRRFFVGDKTNANDYDAMYNVTVASITDATHFVSSAAITYGSGRDVIIDPNYYLYDATAYAANPREATITFPEIDVPYRQPLGINLTQWIPAAYELYKRAKAYLAQHKNPRTVYAVTPLTVSSALLPGQTIGVRYLGRVTRGGVPLNWVDIDTDLYVLKITRTYNGDGTTAVDLEVSDVLVQRSTDGSLISRIASDQASIKRRA